MEHKSEKRICQNCQKDFIIEPDDFSFYEKIKVPPPTFCPECRMIRRMTWRNERSLYKRNCDYNGISMITMFHPDSNVKVYNRKIWWSDKWDPTDYGQDYDFSKPFFEQYKELLSKVPLANVGNTNVENSPYSNHIVNAKNCYLVYGSFEIEDIAYSQGALYSKNCMDTYSVQKCEQCYEDILCDSMFQTHFSYDSDQSLNSFFLNKCVNCNDCISCINLRNKKYCIFNKQYTKEEYLKKKEKLDFGSYKILSNFKKEYKDFILRKPHKYASILKSLNVTGDNIMNSKNTKYSFDLYGEVEDSKFVAHGLEAKDNYDMYGFGAGAYLMYEGVDSGLKASNVYFSVLVHSCMNTNYIYMCYNSKNLFGCIGIRKGEYCILNKKYTKEEYGELVPKIIKHMNDMPYVDKKGRIYKYGEFFPSEISPFSYDESIAQEYFPKSKKKILEEGLNNRKLIKKEYKTTINSKDLPDHIKEVNDEIINEIIACPNNGNELTQCTKAYRIISEELTFLRKHNLPIPHLCPNCRHYERLAQRNPMKLWHRQCMCESKNHNHQARCPIEFETSYSPQRKEIVYCKDCYQKEVY